MRFEVNSLRDLVPRHAFRWKVSDESRDRITASLSALVDNSWVSPFENSDRYRGTVSADSFHLQRRTHQTYLPDIRGDFQPSEGNWTLYVRFSTGETVIVPLILLICIAMGIAINNGFLACSFLILIVHLFGCFDYAKEVNKLLELMPED